MIVGRNGQGKTNLLEAIHVLCGLGSHRATAHTSLVRHGFDPSILRARAQIKDRKLRLDAEIRMKGGIKLRVNEVPFERGRGFGSLPACVVFSPDDLALIKGGPEERRRFLDTICAQTSALGGAHKHEFDKTLRQRNGILKAAQFSSQAKSQLDVWTDQLVAASAKLIKDRLTVLDKISAEVATKYLALAGEGGAIRVRYRPTWADDGNQSDLGLIQELMAEGFARSYGRDLERGITLVGPHRDDLEITLEGEEARLFASQGEQRTLALAFRLAEREMVANSRGEEPILLLDDVFSELDESRRERVAEIVQEGSQAIITATGAEGLPFESERIIRVDQGQFNS